MSVSDRVRNCTNYYAGLKVPALVHEQFQDSVDGSMYYLLYFSTDNVSNAWYTLINNVTRNTPDVNDDIRASVLRSLCR
jgi:hypothetical protein